MQKRSQRIRGMRAVSSASMLASCSEQINSTVFFYSHDLLPGIDFKMKTLEIDGLKVRVQIWDTAGQERYQTITKQYYRRAQGIIFVYDVTNQPSFQHVAKWVSDVDQNAPDTVQRILVGNKCDEELGRQVTREQGSKLAENYGMEFFETSASTNSCITESYTRVAQLVLQAHKRDVDSLLGSLDDYLDKVALEDDRVLPHIIGDSQKNCAC
ncbi:ras-related protein Rab-15-like isoform X2 [Takifugu flavidus]|uniref:ras-related protein Rab-15-like isoform X2 n=1 Tax=Takifugu flavidus TaxID=433684 RepID=UPI002544C02A|nr:ras-related protein Rab-15-like isoform X2 [Takifugu flavidus]